MWYCLTPADIITEITGAQDKELEVTDEDEEKEDKLTRPTSEQERSAIIVLDTKIFKILLTPPLKVFQGFNMLKKHINPPH